MTGAPAEKHFRPTTAIIDLDRVRSNFRLLRGIAQSPDAFQCPMVKANAYGHGDAQVSRALRSVGAQHLGVALIEEGLRLRASGDRGRILVFGVFSKAAEAQEMHQAELTPVVSDWVQLKALEAMPTSQIGDQAEKKIALHFEFNTGMNRLGFEVGDATRLRKWLDTNPRFAVEGICTHLLRGDDARASTDANDLHDLQTSYSLGQLQKFTEALAAFRGLKFIVHALNSSASAAMWKRHAYTSDRNYGPLGARPGIAVYGIEPSEKKELQLGLKPVLSWASQLVSVHHIKTGDVVSYNATWKAKRPSLIGVVPVGYADGYSRSLSNKGSILCRGRRVPIVGTVCMDYFMVDLTDAEKADSEIQSGEPVVLIGEQKSESITAQEIADQRGTITYEVLTNISDRVPRMYLEGESK